MTKLAILMLLSFAFIASVPSFGADADAKEKVLKIALGTEPDNLNPINDFNAYDCIKIFSGLLKTDDKLQMIPDLAESWEVSPDGKTFTFHLRKGMKWHDGTSLTADDVKFTFDLLRSEKWTSIFPISSEFKIIDDISIQDDSTIVFHLKEGVVPFKERFAVPILPKHILNGQDLMKTEFWQEPIGSGPYKFKEWKRGEDLILVANPDYYGGAPKIGEIKYLFVPDENARVSLLKSGEVDVTKIDPRTKKILESTSGIQVITTPSANWYGLCLPNDIWPFSIKEVRQAIAFAINKQQILDTIFYSQGELAYGPYRKADWAYNPEIAYSYDPNKSRQLLADAGFKEGGDGVFEKDGKKLEFDLLYPTYSSERKDMAIAIKTDLAAVGIKVNLVSKTWDEITYQMYHDTAFFNMWGTPFDPDDVNYKVFHSKFMDQGWSNPSSYSNPEVDKLLDEGRITFDEAKRKEIYDKIQMQLVEDQPIAFVVFSNYIYALKDKITGIDPKTGPHGYGNTGTISGELWWNVEQWDLQE